MGTLSASAVRAPRNRHQGLISKPCSYVQRCLSVEVLFASRVPADNYMSSVIFWLRSTALSPD